MPGWFGLTHLIFVAGVLIAAGVFKLRPSVSAKVAATSVFDRFFARPAVAFQAIGVTEFLISIGLILVPRVGIPIALCWCAGMLAYLAYTRKTAPDSSCGCTSRTSVPISWRSFARVGLLIAALTCSALARSWDVESLARQPVPAIGTLLCDSLAFIALSAEYDHRWLIPLRRFRTRIRHPLREASNRSTVDMPLNMTLDIPLQATLQQLYRSPAYRASHNLLRGTVLDHWDEASQWRIVTFPARFGARDATAVFAVPLTTTQPDQVRVVFADATEPTVLTGFSVSAGASMDAAPARA